MMQHGNGRNEILPATATAATNVTYFPTVWPQKNGLKTSFSKENSESSRSREILHTLIPPQDSDTRQEGLTLLDLNCYCTTMESALPIVEVVIFHANERCLGDLGLFKDVRDMVAATTRCVQPGS